MNRSMNALLQLAGFNSPDEVRAYAQRYLLTGDHERRRLQSLETAIERNRKNYSEVGLALAEIREARLYRFDHPSFEEYCRARWNWSRSYAHRVIDAALTVAPLPPEQRPETESQARELARVEPERRAEVLARARASGKLTAAAIRQAAQALRAVPPAPRPAPARSRRNGHSALTALSRCAREELIEAAEDLSMIAKAIRRRELSPDAVKRCAAELNRALKVLRQLVRPSAAA
jgi:hypothetical protein